MLEFILRFTGYNAIGITKLAILALCCITLACNPRQSQDSAPKNNLTPPTDEQIAKAVKLSAKPIQSSKFIQENLNKILDSLLYVNENCPKRLPQEKCYVHHEWAGIPIGGSYRENAIEIKTDSNLIKHEQLVALHARCHWPDPLDSYKNIKNPKIFGFPSSSRICDFFPSYGPRRRTSIIARDWSSSLGSDYQDRVLVEIYKSDKIPNSDKRMYDWEVSIYNYPKYKVVFDVH